MGYTTFHWVHDPGLKISLCPSALLPQMGEWACASEDRTGAKPKHYWFLLWYWPPQGCLSQLRTLAVIGLCFAWVCGRVKYCPSQRLKWLSPKEQKVAVSIGWAKVAIFVSSTCKYFLYWHVNYCFLRRWDDNVAQNVDFIVSLWPQECFCLISVPQLSSHVLLLPSKAGATSWEPLHGVASATGEAVRLGFIPAVGSSGQRTSIVTAEK